MTSISFESMARIDIFREPWPRILGVPLVGSLLTPLFKAPPFHIADFLISIFITGIVWQGAYLIIMGYRKRWPDLADTHKRLMTTAPLISLYIVAIDFTVCTAFAEAGLQENSYLNGEWGSKLWKSFAATAMIGTLYEAGYFFRMWKQQALETEAIKNRQLRTELDILRNQVSPHFLFNSLNTLITLINEDKAQATRFTKDLGTVYRYILQHKDKEVVDLGTELDFTQAYINLMKVRFAESLRITVEIPPEARHMIVAPLTLQMLLENALKHNTASVAEPLHVDIRVENGRTLIVRNSLRRRRDPAEGTGTGLANVKKRYAFLSDTPVDVIETREHFMVAVPLLEMLGKEAPVL